MNGIGRLGIGYVFAWMLMLAVGSIQASELTGQLVVGADPNLAQRTLDLPAGDYKLKLFDPNAGSTQSLAGASVLMVQGVRELHRYVRQSGFATVESPFHLDADTAVTLYVEAIPSQDTGLLLLSIQSQGDVPSAGSVYEDAFVAGGGADAAVEGDTYRIARTFPVQDASQFDFSLTDLGAALFGLPFQSLAVFLTYPTELEPVHKACWYKGDVSGALQDTCVAIDSGTGSPVESGADIHSVFVAQPGFVTVQILATAPPDQLAEIAWHLQQSGQPLMDVVEKVNGTGTSLPDRELGRFQVEDAASATVTLTPLSADSGDFAVAILSANGDQVMGLTAQSPTQKATLNPGLFRIVALPGSAAKGLLGVRINASDTVFFDDAVSLGNYQRLGTLDLEGDTALSGHLHFFLHPVQGMESFQVLLAGSSGVPLTFTDSEPDVNSDDVVPAGRYGVWSTAEGVAGDGYYRVHFFRGENSLGEYQGTLGNRLFRQMSFDVGAATNATLSVHNYLFPSPLKDHLVAVFTQGDALQYVIVADDPEDPGENGAGIALTPGVAYLTVFADPSVAADQATVVGYRVDIGDVDSGGETPPRGANGSGTSGGNGGGGFASFILYCLLVCRIQVRRTRRRDAGYVS